MRIRLLNFLRQRLGLDRAIAASSATQMLRFITGPVTMLLIIRFLTPEEQGFFYSFAGVMGIQVFLEAGFSQSITQFTSREFAHLRFNRQGLLVGNRASLSRLRSIFHKANRYYKLTAAVLTLALAGGGYWFFSLKDSHGVPWMIPWFVASACAGLSFLMTPFWAILEGCNRVAHIAVYRFWQTLAGFAMSAICLFLDQGIYTVVWASVFMIVYPLIYLAYRWRGMIVQIMRPAGSQQVSWRGEIWGFQWRIAAIWGFKYMLFPMTPALAFALAGPIVAGQVGLCYQLAFTGGVLGTVWTVTKLPYWGTLLAQGKDQEFRADWKNASKKHIGVTLLTQLGAFMVIATVQTMGFSFSDRFLSPLAFGGLAMGMFFHSFWLIFSHYFRAKREEHFVSITGVASLLYIGTAWLSSSLGDHSITYSFALANLVGAVTSYLIWNKIK